MVGALLKGTNLLTVEELEEPFTKRFGKIAARNIQAMKRAYEETRIIG